MVVHVRINSPLGGFVKRSSKDGRWYQLWDYLSREKTSQAFRDALSDQYRPINDSKKQHRDRITHRAVSEGIFQASLHAQLKHPSAKNAGAKAQSAGNPLLGGLSLFEEPLDLAPLKNDKEIVSNQPSSQICSLRNFEWTSKNVALLEANDEFKPIDPQKSSEIIPFRYESFEAPECTSKLCQAVIDERSIFDRLVILVDKQDNGDDPFEPTHLPARTQSRCAVN
jgi:hypothetical protein